MAGYTAMMVVMIVIVTGFLTAGLLSVRFISHKLIKSACKMVY